jgi:acetyl-CoA carboxylase alpha subunit
MALEAIYSVVPPEMIIALTTKQTEEEACESIQMMRVGDDRIMKAST